METINNVALTAARAVWGENGNSKEPVSGENGDVTRGEPYDAGNLDPEQQKKYEKESNELDEKSNLAKATDATKTTTATTATTDTTDNKEINEKSATQADIKGPDGENPEDAKADVSGPGPRPLVDVAREHDGDAGRDKDEPVDPADPGQSSEKAKDGEVIGPDSHGTGEKVVHATGFAADGGDFDASKPGAGYEADRLLEEKGVHKDDAPKQSTPAATESVKSTNDSTTESPKSKDKDAKKRMSLGDRIKAKLHRKSDK